MINNNINTFPQDKSTSYDTLERIHQGIEDYFECRLSEHQEKLLRQVLASARFRTPQIEECMAVMGFKTVQRRTISEKRPQEIFHSKTVSEKIRKTSLIHRRKWVAAVAASILLAILVAVPLLREESHYSVESNCYAWIEGSKITEEDVVMRMLMEDLEEFDQGMSQINDDFNSTMEYLSQIIEENENPL